MDIVKIGIMEPEDFSEEAINTLKKVGEVALYAGSPLDEFLRDKMAIFVRLKYYIDDGWLHKAPKLKYICSPTTGLNHINISDTSVQIISLKGEYDFLDTIRATPEHVFGLTLGLLRNYSHCFLNENNREWKRDLYKGYELYGARIGIIGFGRVGKIIAGYFYAFGATVSYFDIADKKTGFHKCLSQEELILTNDIIILAANYTQENKKMVAAHEFELMKNKYFINAARGELVDEDQMLNYIKKDWFAGVAIDVLSGETLGSRILEELITLQKERNILITPHIGGATYSSMKRTEEFIASKLCMALQII